MSDRVEPFELWCWKCPRCGEVEIMGTTASATTSFHVLTCDRCNKQSEVTLPENVDDRD